MTKTRWAAVLAHSDVRYSVEFFRTRGGEEWVLRYMAQLAVEVPKWKGIDEADWQAWKMVHTGFSKLRNARKMQTGHWEG